MTSLNRENNNGNDKNATAFCPLCGKSIKILYPEILLGFQNATCQTGHKIKIRKDSPSKAH